MPALNPSFLTRNELIICPFSFWVQELEQQLRQVLHLRVRAIFPCPCREAESLQDRRWLESLGG